MLYCRCEAHKIQFSPKVMVTTQNVVHGRGMVAKEDIDEFEVLFSIPRAALLSAATTSISDKLAPPPAEVEDDNDDEEGDNDDEEGDNPPPPETPEPDQASEWTQLLLALMFEEGQGDSSPFAAYLATMPARDSLTHPFFWADGDVRQLDDLRLGAALASDLSTMQEQHAQVVVPFVAEHPDDFTNAGEFTSRPCSKGRDARFASFLCPVPVALLLTCSRPYCTPTYTCLGFAFPDTSFDNFLRWAAVVMAYSFTDDVDGRVCMVPVADILNHVTGKNNARLFYSQEKLEVRGLCWRGGAEGKGCAEGGGRAVLGEVEGLS